MSIQQCASDLGSDRRAVRELLELVVSATRADIIVVWALAFALVGVLALLAGLA